MQDFELCGGQIELFTARSSIRAICDGGDSACHPGMSFGIQLSVVEEFQKPAFIFKLRDDGFARANHFWD